MVKSINNYIRGLTRRHEGRSWWKLLLYLIVLLLLLPFSLITMWGAQTLEALGECIVKLSDVVKGWALKRRQKGKPKWDRLEELRRRWSRSFWEKRAAALPRTGWFVGRTDMHSYVNGKYVHYAYPPDDGPRVAFRGSPTAALRKAVMYAEKQNKRNHGQPLR